MTETELRIHINRLCECGGRPPNDPEACSACVLLGHIDDLKRRLAVIKKAYDTCNHIQVMRVVDEQTSFDTESQEDEHAT